MGRHAGWCGWVVVVLLVVTGVFAQEGDEAPDASDQDLPLEAGRTIAITTDEGSWLSLDVSPDGRTVVFDLLGDLYLLSFDGGVARALTEGMAYDSQPRFSPDGSRVLFVSDRDGAENLWVVDVASRETEQLTEGKTSSYESPEWLPDGRYVVASKTTGTSGSSRIPQALDVARRRGRRSPADRRAGHPPNQRRRAHPRWAIHLVRPADGSVAVQRDLSPVSARRLRPGQRRALHPLGPLRVGLSSDDLTRRSVARLWHAARERDRATAPRPRHGRGALAGVSGAA